MSRLVGMIRALIFGSDSFDKDERSNRVIERANKIVDEKCRLMKSVELYQSRQRGR